MNESPMHPSGTSGPSSPMGASPPHAEAHEGLREVHRRLEDLHTVQHASRNTILLASFIILAETLVFGLALYGRMRGNFAPEKVRAEGQRIAEVVGPQVSQKLLDAAVEVAPVYRQHAGDRVRLIAPAVGRELATQFETVPDEIQKHLDEALRSQLQEVVARLRPGLVKLFPEAGGDVEPLIGKIEQHLAIESEAVESHINEVFRSDTERVRAALARLGEPEGVPDRVELERQWVHLLLMYADYELMQHAQAAPAETPTPTSATQQEGGAP